MEKIKNFFTNHFKTILAILGCSFLIVPICLLIYSKTIDGRNFILANYESYMSPKIERKLAKAYNVNFDSFESAEGAKRLILNNSADIINITTYEVSSWAQQGLIKKIDWSNFDIPGINNSNDALNLFNDVTKKVLTHYDIDGDGTKDNLLDYGVPYFLQDLIFCYRGTKINEFNDSLSWKDVLNIITRQDRFKTNSAPKIIALDDKRSMYSIPRTIQTSNSNPTIQPQVNATISDLEHTYTYLSNEINLLGSNAIKLNSDSNAVLNEIATGVVNGAFMFNGDAIYAASGGDNNVSINEDDFHIVKPVDKLVALDMMVINNNLPQNLEETSYKLLKELCLDFNDENSTTYQNFDYVNYTPTLNSLYNYVINNDYFEGNNTLIDAYKINNVLESSIEEPISDLVKSNLSIAWITFKNSV